MAVIKDFYLGETHIMIDDSACAGQTDEERDRIFKEAADEAVIRLFEQERARRRGMEDKS